MFGYSIVQHVGGWIVLLDPLQRHQNVTTGEERRGLIRLVSQQTPVIKTVFVPSLCTDLMHVAVLQPLVGS